MKLRNKKTGRVLTKYSIRTLEGVDADKGTERIVLIDDEANDKWYYDTLAEFNAWWEDYEEDKDHYYIGMFGTVDIVESLGFTSDFIDDKIVPQLKEIGNYFDTEEDAKKIVEKLKALKRLKDNGFKFEGWKRDEKYCGDFTIYATDQTSCDYKDLDLLFGGEK